MTVIKKKKKLKGRTIFYICAAAWSVIQFILFYLCVNLNSILLAFKDFEYGEGYTFVGFDNFVQVVKDFQSLPYMGIALKNTFQVFFIGIVIMFIPNRLGGGFGDDERRESAVRKRRTGGTALHGV